VHFTLVNSVVNVSLGEARRPGTCCLCSASRIHTPDRHRFLTYQVRPHLFRRRISRI